MQTELSAAHPTAIQRTPTILVVEDEALIRMAMAEFLEDSGLHVVEAGSAAEAIGIIEHNPGIALVFSDVMMPGGMDGIGLAGWVDEHRPGLPVVLASGYTGDAHIGQALSGHAFFAKPYSMDAVARTIRAEIAMPVD